MATLEETFDAALGRQACARGKDRITGGRTAQQLYDGVAGDEAGEAHMWLVLVAITDNTKAKEVMVAWLQDVASNLPDGEVKDQLNALTPLADAATLVAARKWETDRVKAKTTEFPIERAYKFVTQWLLQGATPLGAVMPGRALLAHRVKHESMTLAAAKQTAYDFFRAQVDFATFNPDSLA